MTALILVSLVAFCAGCLFWLLARSRAEKLDAVGILVSADESDSEPLVSDRHELVGWPDYVYRLDGELIPVERKSRKVGPRGPYDGEILQLAAYCLLVEERYQQPVQRGRLQYLNRSVDIRFDAQLRAKLMGALAAIKKASLTHEVPRSHESPARCRACGFQGICDQSLVQEP